MALGDSKILRAIFFSMGALLALGFLLRIYLALTSTSGDANYRGGRGLELQYSSVAVLAVVVAGVLIFCGITWAIQRWRDKRDRDGGV